MNSHKWTWFAILYECGFAYAVSFVVFHLVSLFSGHGNVAGSIIAFVLLAIFIWLLVRPQRNGKVFKDKAFEELIC